MAVTELVWFGKFVGETVDAWTKLPKKQAAYEENLLAHAIGKLGERYVVNRLAGGGYHAAQSPRSRSPSDVWGMGIVGGILHLPLLQVRASERGQPDELSRDEQVAFAKFTAFAFERFRECRAVPGETRNAPLVVSAWYAGVQIVKKRKLVSWGHVYATHDDHLEGRAQELLRAFDDSF